VAYVVDEHVDQGVQKDDQPSSNDVVKAVVIILRLLVLCCVRFSKFGLLVGKCDPAEFWFVVRFAYHDDAIVVLLIVGYNTDEVFLARLTRAWVEALVTESNLVVCDVAETVSEGLWRLSRVWFAEELKSVVFEEPGGSIAVVRGNSLAVEVWKFIPATFALGKMLFHINDSSVYSDVVDFGSYS
jgi:hypothetical protein